MENPPGSPRFYEAPDRGVGGSSTSGKEPEENHGVEDAANSMRYFRSENLSSEMIGSAETPEELFIGLRQLEKQLEDANIPQGLSERYTPPRELSIMYERSDMLGFTIEDLQKRGWIKSYDPITGEAQVRDRRFAPLAIRTEMEDYDEKGRYSPKLKCYFGKSEEERKTLEKAYRRATVELEARDIMGEHIGLRLNLDFRDSLEELTAALHGGRMPKFKADHLEAIFNMPEVPELATNPENRQLGDKVEEAMFLNLVMLYSGNKERMLDFLGRPGAKFLIAKLAKEKGMTYDEWKRKYIGDVEAWEDDNKRLLTDTNKELATWRVEAGDGRRGALTKWSNISAWGGKPSEFGADKEKEFIEETIGGLVGSIEASWVAATMMRVIGAYASEGYVALPNGKSLLPLGEGRYISGDDTGKFWAYMFNYKEGMKGRASGLKDMIGKIPDMAMNLFDWAQVVVGHNTDGTEIRRSIWDAWLGTAGGKAKKDLLTNKEDPDKKTVEEPYQRLGSLNFQSLEREFHGTFTIMQWLMGNREGPTGVFIDAMSTDFRFEDFALNALKKKWKYIDIVMNPNVLTKGSPHLYTNAEDAPKTIKKNFLRNLMSARIHSASFALGILNSTVRLFNPSKVASGQIEVPAPLLVKMFVDEVMKDLAPTGVAAKEEDLIKHYIDDNIEFRTAGTASNVEGVVAGAKFEEIVGRVTGRRKS